MDASPDDPRVIVTSAAALEHLIRTVFTTWGLSPESASTAAHVMTDTDLAGIDSHGLAMLPAYERLLNAGDLNIAAVPEIVSEGPSHAALDGHGGLGHIAATRAVDLASTMAEKTGTGVVTVRNSHHFGAVGHYVARSAARGLVCLAATTTRVVSVLPARAAAPRMGTNPLAFGAPTGLGWPLVMDISTSTVASNKVRAYGLRKKPLAPGWVLDGSGNSIVDSGDAHALIQSDALGGLSALGGTEDMANHKGYGLAIMVQVLAATLCGAAFSPLRASGATDDIGHFFLALDPGAFRKDGGFVTDIDAMIEVLHATPPIDPSRPVLIPGQCEEMSRRHRRVHGIPVPGDLADEIRNLCGRHGVPFTLVDAANNHPANNDPANNQENVS